MLIVCAALQVVVSKIERMELSMIQINEIWDDQSPHFQNLMHLDVNGCQNLKYLLSLSMARNLKKLQSLFISECEKMEYIFSQGQCRDAKIKVRRMIVFDSIFIFLYWALLYHLQFYLYSHFLALF